uniref:NADH-ubiquinone oxidoreductase chain 4L n=1 Tax=Paralvinella sulfincola TaxID=644278 RepID=G8XXL9_9ANNE|nr:NADH dehydrogenase subunit 4L [Paralvinella sulfincola]
MSFQIIFATMLFSAMATLISQRKHFLMALLSLEAITLISVGLIVTTMGTPVELDTTLFIIVVSFAAVEGSMGLSILVSISRKTGTELIQSLTISKC